MTRAVLLHTAATCIVAALAMPCAYSEEIGLSLEADSPVAPMLGKRIADAGKDKSLSFLERLADNRVTQLSNVKELLEATTGLIVRLIEPSDGSKVSELAADGEQPLLYIGVEPDNLADLRPNQSFIGFDEVGSGTQLMEAFCERLPTTGSPDIEVPRRALILMGRTTDQQARMRMQGIEGALKSSKCAGVTIADVRDAQWSRTTAENTMTRWLTAGFSFEGVIAANDEMALGAIDALKTAGRDVEQLVIAGIGTHSSTLDELRSGALDFTIYQNEGELGMQTTTAIVSLLSKKPVASLHLRSVLVTPDNVDDLPADDDVN